MRGALRCFGIAVPVLWVLVAHVGPLVAMARISVMDTYPAPPGQTPNLTLGAYTALLVTAGYRASLLRSIGLSVVVTAVSFLLAFPLAYHVALHVPPARRARRLMLLAAPFWTSEVLRMFALVLLFAHRGALNALLRGLGLPELPGTLLYGDSAVLAGIVYTVFLSMLLPLYAALDRLPSRLLDAAAVLGAGPWRRMLLVTLPLAARGIASGCALTFLAGLGVLAAPALLGGPTTPVFATTIVDLFGAASGRWPLGAAFGLILLAVGTAIAAATVALPLLIAPRPQVP